MSLSIIKAGAFATVQGLGRMGFQKLGIGPGGAMDRASATVANYLVANQVEEAVIEMYYPAPEILFHKAAIIAISGAHFSPQINGVKVDINRPIFLQEGSKLKFQNHNKGAVSYLAIKGGFKIEKWLNSYSTFIKAGIGGFKGRMLKSGDDIEFNQSVGKMKGAFANGFLPMSWGSAFSVLKEPPQKIKILKGRHWSLLSKSSKQKIQEDFFTIGNRSDKMGFQLVGEPLQKIKAEEIISSAVQFGTIQLLPNGQLIVLMADHQTTGGYPMAAHVITAHLPFLAQMQAGSRFQFQVVDVPSAEKLYLEQKKVLRILKQACYFKHQNFEYE